MKMLCALMSLLFCLSALMSCKEIEVNESSNEETVSLYESLHSSVIIEESNISAESSETDKNKILTADEMEELESITSVIKNEQYSSRDAVFYDINFVSDELKLNAQMALPSNYSDRNYPTVIYFPELTYDEEFLIDNFAQRGLNVIRLSSRGINGNEGTKDICGEDFADAELLLEICKATAFLSRGGIAVIGSAEGSVRALKLAAEYPNDIAGCAVINVLSDIESLCKIRGDGITEYFERIIGGTIEELPEEYKKRSAIHFADKIKVPVLIFSYEDTPKIPKQQAEILKKALDDVGGNCEIYDINATYSDFNGTAFFKLIPWIIKLTEDK